MKDFNNNALITVCLLLAVLIVGCGRHDTSLLPQALIGHWVNETGNTHYYFDSTSLCMMDKNRRMDSSYTILESNEVESWIKIRVRTRYEVGHDKLLVFSSDRKALTSTIESLGIKVSRKWTYVDSKKMP